MLNATEWLSEIENALDYRDTFGREQSWIKNELNYYNDAAGDAVLSPNLVWSMGDTLLASLLVPDPEITVQAEREKSVGKAPIVESIDNWLMHKLELKQTIEDAVLNAFLYSKAILKIGYDSEYGYNPYWDIGPNNVPWGMTFTQYDKKGDRIEYADTQPGMPWVSVCHPSDIVVPWGTKYLKNAPWIAHRFVRLNSYFKKDVKYKNTSRLEPQISMEDFMNTYKTIGAKQHRFRTQNSHTQMQNAKPMFNVGWEIHDRMSGQIIVVCEDYDKFLRKEQDVLQVAGLPFVAKDFVPHPRHFWSTPLAYYLGQLQSVQHDISIQAGKQRRLSVLRFLVAQNAISKDEFEKWINGDVGAVGMVERGEDLNKTVKAFPAVVDQTSEIQSQANRRDAREAIGFGRNQLGDEMQSSRRTAAEVGSVERGSMTRTSKRMDVVRYLYLKTFEKLNKICFTFWKTPRSIQVGPDWIPFTGEEINGDYMLSLSLSNKRTVSSAQRKTEALMVLVQFAQMGMASPQLVQYVMNAANDPEFSRILMPFAQKNQGGGGGGKPAGQGQAQGGQR